MNWVDRGNEQSGATFSPCGNYRYLLWRKWCPETPSMGFIGLNPSTADEHVNDATITRLMKRAKDLGAGGLIVGNLFAFRAKEPDDMKKCEEPIGRMNDKALLDIACGSYPTLCGWGVHGEFQNRASNAMHEILRVFPANFSCLGLTKGGQPRHPLYISYKVHPIPFKPSSV